MSLWKIGLTIAIAFAFIVAAWAVHPGLGIAVALLAYGAVDGLLSK